MWFLVILDLHRQWLIISIAVRGLIQLECFTEVSLYRIAISSPASQFLPLAGICVAAIII